ncbi:hypothetical protein BYT27DRAFT_7210500 [Phlegmacium glaucopus]|nr:hypothetical protein BYT27DRAFT_7210500 [Phlegmacium glaucopus]
MPIQVQKLGKIFRVLLYRQLLRWRLSDLESTSIDDGVGESEECQNNFLLKDAAIWAIRWLDGLWLDMMIVKRRVSWLYELVLHVVAHQEHSRQSYPGGRSVVQGHDAPTLFVTGEAVRFSTYKVLRLRDLMGGRPSGWRDSNGWSRDRRTTTKRS